MNRRFFGCPPPWVEDFARVSELPFLVDPEHRNPLLHGSKVRVGLPCCGIDGFSRCLQDLGVQYELVWAFDISDTLLLPLRRLHGVAQAGRLRLGAEAGDILRQDPDTLEDVHLIAAGPPCPPWSGFGDKQAEDDPRSLVFWATVSIVLSQIRRKALRAFVLENVEGIDQCINKQPPFLQSLRAKFRKEAPGWTLHKFEMNTRDCGLPQSRPRVYLVGLPDEIQGHAVTSLPAQMPGASEMFPLHEFLDPRIPCTPPTTPQQKSNLLQYEEALKEKPPAYSDGEETQLSICAFDVTRDMTKKNINAKYNGVCPTLTTSNTGLWLIFHGKYKGVNIELSRRLHHTERPALQGFSLASLSCLNKTNLTHAVGNAFPPCVIGRPTAFVLQMLFETRVLGPQPMLPELVPLYTPPPGTKVAAPKSWLLTWLQDNAGARAGSSSDPMDMETALYVSDMEKDSSSSEGEGAPKRCRMTTAS